MSKYEAFGHRFDSLIERNRYLELREREEQGLIASLEVHPGPFELVPAWTDAWGKRWRAITYTADFAYTEEGGTRVVEDVKPAEKRAWSHGRDVPLRMKLLAIQHPEWRVRVWMPASEWKETA